MAENTSSIRDTEPLGKMTQRLLLFCRGFGKNPYIYKVYQNIPWMKKLNERARARERESRTFVEKGMETFQSFHTHTNAQEEIHCLEMALDYFNKALAAKYETPELFFVMAKCLALLGRNREFNDIYAHYIASKRRDADFIAFEQKAVRYLPQSCLISLGCMGYLTTHVMANRLSNIPKKYIAIASEQTIANKSFLSYFSEHIDFLNETDAFHHESARARFETPIDWALEYKDKIDNIHAVTSVVCRQWQEQGRAPLLRLRDDHRAKAHEALREQGIDPNAWFVCIHARTSGFYQEGNEKEAFRNADIETYRKAIAAIVAQGGLVFRMGDNSMPPFVAKGVIDYAHSPLKSDWMDVYLLASCRFFLGTSSGPHKIPFSFGVPCVQTNAAPMGFAPFFPTAILLPKLLREKKTGRYLSFQEMLSEPYCAAAIQYLYDALDVEALPNTQEEIYDAVCNMLASFEGGSRTLPALTPLQHRFHQLAEQAGVVISCPVDAGFLARHEVLLH